MGCCQVRVDVATLADAYVVTRMIGRFLEGTAYGRLFAYRPERVAHFAEAVITTHGVVFLARTGPEDDPSTIGLIAGAAHHEPIAGLYIAEELAWWIEPEQRGLGRAAVRLQQALEDWATAKGCVLLKMVAPADNPGVGDYYRRQGYEPIETAWVKPLQRSAGAEEEKPVRV